MDKKIVIIIPNELDVNIKPFFYTCNIFHIEGLKEFIYQNDLSVSSPILINSNIVSRELTEQGFVVILIDDFYIEENIKNLSIFIPEKISPGQYKYLESQKEELFNYNLNILKKEETANFKIIDQTTTNRPIIDELVEILNNRLIEINKTKKLKPKNKN